MTQTALSQIFDGLSSKLQSDFDFLSAQFKHRPSRGFVREYVLKELLRKYLPGKLAIGSGVIVSSDGAKSKQIDIVIYDSMNTPIMYGAGDLQIFPVECVYAVVEVKSYLNSGELVKSIDNIRSVKSMPKIAYVPHQSFAITTTNLYGKELDFFPVLGFVFAYDSIKNTKILKDKLAEKDDKQDLANNLDAICILNKAMITNFNPIDGKSYSTKEPNSTRVFIHTQRSLLYFYLQLMHALPQASMRPIQMTKYAEQVVYGRIEV